MRCSACQTEIPADASTCPKCGASAFAAGEAPTIWEGAGGTGGAMVSPLSTFEGPTLQVGAELAAIAPGAVPERFDNFQLLRRPDGSIWELGRGAMGITYKAFDTDLHIEVVLKVINPAALANADSRERFLREARAAAKLRHANIATIYRLDEADGVQFYAMEFCDGETVHQFVERHGPLELKVALEIALQVTNALVVAQELGVVHRDIKPANLMITGRPPEEFTVKVIDFGLAKLGAPGTAAADVTVGSARYGFVGTAHFASPEQLEDRPVDFRSDIYSLGVTLYFMLTARPLFEGTMVRVVMQHLAEAPSLEKLDWLPAETRALLEKMLAKNPDGRPASTRELRSALRACLEATPANPRSAEAPAVLPEGPPTLLNRDSGARFAPPGERPPSAAAQSAAATRPPMPVRQPGTSGLAARSPASPLVAKPQPVSRPGLVIAAGLLILLFLSVLIFALIPLGKRLLTGRGAEPVQVPVVENNEPIAAADAPGASDAELTDALRDVRNAQDAAEKFSTALRSLSKNEQLIALVEKRAVPDPEALQGYRIDEEVIGRRILDAETAYLIAAKRLRSLPAEKQRAAFEKLSEEVSGIGENWRVRVTQIIRKDLPQLAPDAVHMSEETREALKRLQDDQ